MLKTKSQSAQHTLKSFRKKTSFILSPNLLQLIKMQEIARWCVKLWQAPFEKRKLNNCSIKMLSTVYTLLGSWILTQFVIWYFLPFCSCSKTVCWTQKKYTSNYLKSVKHIDTFFCTLTFLIVTDYWNVGLLWALDRKVSTVKRLIREWGRILHTYISFSLESFRRASSVDRAG